MSRRFVYYGAGRSADVLLFDLYPAEAGFYLHKLRTAYNGNCIRVRRSSDNAETDIGFDGVDLDTSSLMNFVGNGSGYVVRFYNQGNLPFSFDLIQNTLSQQYSIVENGVLNTINGKPFLNTLNRSNMDTTNRIDDVETVFWTAKIDVLTQVNYIFYSTSGNIGGGFQGGTFGSVDGIGAFDNTSVNSIASENLNQQMAYLNIRNGNLYASLNDGSEQNTGSFGINSFSANQVFGRQFSNIYFRGKVTGIIFYQSDQSSNRLAINNIINNYYGIY